MRSKRRRIPRFFLCAFSIYLLLFHFLFPLLLLLSPPLNPRILGWRSGRISFFFLPHDVPAPPLLMWKEEEDRNLIFFWGGVIPFFFLSFSIEKWGERGMNFTEGRAAAAAAAAATLLPNPPISRSGQDFRRSIVYSIVKKENFTQPILVPLESHRRLRH